MASLASTAQDAAAAAADVAVAERVEQELRRQGLNLKGSSDKNAWASPSDFWRDANYRETWYAKAIDYWENTPAVPCTVDGVLGGFAMLDAPDVRASRRFLADARHAAGQSGEFVAADVAAGIGRVTKHVLLPGGAASVDVLEPARPLREASPAFVDSKDTVEGIDVGGLAARCTFSATPMQDWVPTLGTYDVIWAQWCVGHLADAHFLRFLSRCRTALKSNGILIIKDNCCASSKADECFEVDDADRSMCRGRAYLEALLEFSGADVFRTALQATQAGHAEAFPADIYPVRSYALRWAGVT